VKPSLIIIINFALYDTAFKALSSNIAKRATAEALSGLFVIK
jgi:hypothetical protein